MKIIFRTDASLDIGTGHVMRCLTLAQALREHGANCSFICRRHRGNLIDLIRQRGFEVQVLPMQVVLHARIGQQGMIDENILAHSAWLGADWQIDANQTKNAIGDREVDWLIVDHYALDVRWESALKPYYKRLMVIDDLADRPHGCDLLLDQNLSRTEQHYSSLVSPNCQVLIGPQYALLRPEFSELRQYSLSRRATPQLKRLLITMGGVDKDNATGQILITLNRCALPSDCRITVVMGAHAPWLDQVRNQAKNMPWSTEVLVSIDKMAELMTESDLAIGAAGSTSWERCCLGLPAINVALTNNQLFIAKGLEIATRVKSAKIESLEMDIIILLNEIVSETTLLKEISTMSSLITSGSGTIKVLGFLLAKVTA